MDSGNPGARPEPKPDINPKNLPILTTTTYPKPPRLFTRFLFLCLKPEAWAAAARYPFRVTLLPSFSSPFFTSAAVVNRVSVSCSRIISALVGFAKTYDAIYPNMEINSDGILSVADHTRLPINVNIADGHIIVDTTGKTAFDAIKDSTVIQVIHDRFQFFRRQSGVDLPELKNRRNFQSHPPSQRGHAPHQQQHNPNRRRRMPPFPRHLFHLRLHPHQCPLGGAHTLSHQPRRQHWCCHRKNPSLYPPPSRLPHCRRRPRPHRSLQRNHRRFRLQPDLSYRPAK